MDHGKYISHEHHVYETVDDRSLKIKRKQNLCHKWLKIKQFKKKKKKKKNPKNCNVCDQHECLLIHGYINIYPMPPSFEKNKLIQKKYFKFGKKLPNSL